MPFNTYNPREHSFFYINYIFITHNCYQIMLYMPSRPIWLKKRFKWAFRVNFRKIYFSSFSSSIFDEKCIFIGCFFFVIQHLDMEGPLNIYFLQKYNLWLWESTVLQSLCFICHKCSTSFPESPPPPSSPKPLGIQVPFVYHSHHPLHLIAAKIMPNRLLSTPYTYCQTIIFKLLI